MDDDQGNDEYELSEEDPDILENGVLINLLDITTTQALNEVESDMAAAVISELLELPPPQEFFVDTLQKIHFEIFSDIYPWAGKFRKVDMVKGDTRFEHHGKIAVALDSLFSSLESQDYFYGLSETDFVTHSAIFFSELNRIHPFREGNGRTQRLLLTQIAMNTGFQISWESVSDEAMKRACIEGGEGNFSKMERLISVNLKKIDAPKPPSSPSPF